MKYRRAVFLTILLFSLFGRGTSGQNANGSLIGQVTDPSGAVVIQANVSAIDGKGLATTTVTNRRGVYEFKELAPGKYEVQVTAKGFAPFIDSDVTLVAGQPQRFDIRLALPTKQENLEVRDETIQVNVSPSMDTAGAVIVKGKDLDAFSDDSDELAKELAALAGPAAGPNGGQIYIDGFTGGRLPPKSSIREVRINQNPFSAEFDKIGYGRAEVFTKPGTEGLHGQFRFSDNPDFMNSKNPYITGTLQPSLSSQLLEGVVSGPLTRKASYFLIAERSWLDDNSIVNASGVPADLGLGQEAVPNRKRRTSASPRLDYQVSDRQTVTVRYQFTQADETSAGIGGLALASQGYNTAATEQTLQISDTQILSPKTINETRFQYIRDRGHQRPLSDSPAINVLGAFLAGGNSSGRIGSHLDRYEAQNYTTMVFGRHLAKFGGRLRVAREAYTSNGNFNGTFLFPSLAAFQLGQPSQFSITTGQPDVTVSMVDLGLFLQDEWRIRPNMSLSYGLRFETQNHIADHADWAPRLSFMWGLDGHGDTPAKTVLRTGFGIFYDRFTIDQLLTQELLNGTRQQQFVVSSPSFYPNIPPPGSLANFGVLPTIYQVNPHLHAPYAIQTAVAIERQIAKQIILALTYINSRGFDQFLTRNINAPLPGMGASPLVVGLQPIYQYASEGIYRQNQLVANFRVVAGSKLSLFGFYMLNFSKSDTAGASSFPSNQYDILADYGRATNDIRHSFTLGGTITTPYGLVFNPFLLAQSSRPYNITVGSDLNGDSIFNDRPSVVTSQTLASNITNTPCGPVDISGSGTPIPINCASGPGAVVFNLRLSRTIGLGKKSAPAALGGGHASASSERYALTFAVVARNLFNVVNPGMPIGVIGAPWFGRSNQLATFAGSSGNVNRRVSLMVQFGF
jgi:hypothetical protein